MEKDLDVGSNSLQLDERDKWCHYVPLCSNLVELASGWVQRNPGNYREESEEFDPLSHNSPSSFISLLVGFALPIPIPFVTTGLHKRSA
jgi:hypothetical protein